MILDRRFLLAWARRTGDTAVGYAVTGAILFLMVYIAIGVGER